MKGNIIKYARDNIDTDVIIPGTISESSRLCRTCNSCHGGIRS